MDVIGESILDRLSLAETPVDMVRCWVPLGDDDGESEGDPEGATEGIADGSEDGLSLGEDDGAEDGSEEGLALGRRVCVQRYNES